MGSATADRGIALALATRWQRFLGQMIDGVFAGIPMFLVPAMEPDYRPWKLGATLFTLFGLLALVVAGVGVYSSVSYGVSQRTHEFGVRVALGATTGNVLSQVLAEGLQTVVIGVAVGIALTLAAGRLVASLLYGVRAGDPIAMLVAAWTLVAVAAIASLIPAWRAAKANPVEALRAD